jgi:NAD(P)-dependent dehydrogenase (short-subunit alcohol dehydrogenase family)
MNRPQPFLEVDEATLDLPLGRNVRAAFVVAQAAARLMVANGAGVIINVSSQMGHVGSDLNRTVYVMTKHAVEGLTKAMAVELAPKGVRVVSIAPTFVTTPLTKPFFEDPMFRKWVLDRISLGPPRYGRGGRERSRVPRFSSRFARHRLQPLRRWRLDRLVTHRPMALRVGTGRRGRPTPDETSTRALSRRKAGTHAYPVLVPRRDGPRLSPGKCLI